MAHCPYQNQASSTALPTQPNVLHSGTESAAPRAVSRKTKLGRSQRLAANLPVPRVIQALWAMRDPEGFFRARSGGSELFAVNLPGFSTIHVTGTAAGAREMLSAPSDVYRTIPGSPIDAVFGANSMMAVDGERHQRQRRLIIPCFGPGKAKGLGPSFAAIAQKYLAALPEDCVMPLQQLMQDLALDVIIEVIFGVHDAAGKDRFTKAITAFVAAATPSLLLIAKLRHRIWPPWRRFLRAQAELDRCLLEQVRHLRAHPSEAQDSLLRVMLSTKDPSGDALSDEELRDELRMLLVAGHETTATTMTWAVYYALANQNVYDKLCTEVRAAGEDVHGYDALPYLDAVCHEALRIHSVPPFAFRTLRKPLVVCGKELPPGSNLALSLMLLHGDANVFEHPREFRPERFIGRKYDLFAFLPFGSGVRRCIASSFALSEMQVILATMLRRANFSLATTVRPKLILKHINSGPDRPIPVRIVKRKVEAVQDDLGLATTGAVCPAPV